ncbi:AIM24 family protein [Jeotgalibacillus aurantiacus]|uniref:AIM24 family protein n=1 Tax=Jeotgalibacillus aurantiacus TaxID=2763266 RepID=UPI001D0A0447|nr:AIM24 family protein [Jeotgalibacillus aurantiacus]
MSKYSIKEFVQETKQEESSRDFFELETDRILEVNLNGKVWAKAGSMISYEGNIKFEREGMMEHGLGRFVKKALSGEGAQLMKANGQGRLYVADQGKKITVLDLEGESVFINGNDLLAFQDGLEWDIKLMRKVAGMMAGGLFNVRLEGQGLVAFTSHYEPLTLLVTPDRPVFTDPNATVAWSGNLEPEFVTDVQLKSLFGRGSGESVQMKFSGNGFVVVQPFEEIYQTQQS